jgi:hypothetical protein
MPGTGASPGVFAVACIEPHRAVPPESEVAFVWRQ